MRAQVSIKVDIKPERVAGRHVILVEDIIDTGESGGWGRGLRRLSCGVSGCEGVARRRNPAGEESTHMTEIHGAGVDVQEKKKETHEHGCWCPYQWLQ